MIDPFVLLAPFLMFAVIALLRFVGCEAFFPLEAPSPDPPTNLRAIPGNNRVDLSWDPYPDATGFTVKRGESSQNYAVSFAVAGTETSFADTLVVNGTTYFYNLTVRVGAVESAIDPALEVEVVPKKV
jgi:fibronectin type 3 domain-containing protein